MPPDMAAVVRLEETGTNRFAPLASGQSKPMARIRRGASSIPGDVDGDGHAAGTRYLSLLARRCWASMTGIADPPWLTD